MTQPTGGNADAGHTESASANRRSWDRILNDRPTMLAMLFFVTAALGLPFLWQSRAFSFVAKLALSVIVTLYTILLLWGFWLLMVWCYQRVVNSL